jgi:hypothetical protein
MLNTTDMMIHTEKEYHASIEYSNALARRIPEEFFNKGNPFLLCEICAPNFVLNPSKYIRIIKKGGDPHAGLRCEYETPY